MEETKMTTYKVSTVWKKSVQENNWWVCSKLRGLTILEETGYRWGSAYITPTPEEIEDFGIDILDEEMEYDSLDITAFDNFDWDELDDQWSAYTSISYLPDNMTIAEFMTAVDESMVEQITDLIDEYDIQDDEVEILIETMSEQMSCNDITEMLDCGDPTDWELIFSGPIKFTVL